MPTKKPSDNKFTCGCLVVVAVVAGIFIAVNAGKSSKHSTGLEFLGADPQAFQTAADLYTIPPKQKLSVDEVANLMTQLDSYVTSGTYPEDPGFRSVLLKLDGAGDAINSVEDGIETAALSYSEKFSGSQTSTASAQTLFLQGNTEYEAGKLQAATDSYIKALAIAPDHQDARNNLGLCDLHLGNNVSALMQFSIILAQSPTYLGAEQNLSVTLERMGLSSKALKHAQSIVAANQDLPMAQYNLGWFESQNNNFSDAASAFDAALKLYPKYTKASHANAINSIASGEKLTKSDLAALPTTERSLYSSGLKKPVASVWWWILMVIAIITLFGLTIRAASNNHDGAIVWGALSTIALIIGVIIFAIFFRYSSNYSTVLWCLVILNIFVMMGNSG